MQLREWNARLHGLVVFRALLGDPVVAKLAALTDRLEAADDTIAPLCDAVAAFEAALFAHTTNLGDYLSNAVLETETFCVRQAAAGQLSPVMEAALNSELNFLQKLCGLTLDALLEANAGRELDTASDVKPARTAGMLIAISLACTAAAAGATLCVMRVMRLRKTKKQKPSQH